MKVSIKTIKITSVISALSLVIALLMGAEYFKDASQIYLFGISWVHYKIQRLGFSEVLHLQQYQPELFMV